MPTTRYGHVRKIMKAGLAVPVCNNPFTIRLKYETPDIVQSLYLGIDTGRENIGLAVSKENGECVIAVELDTHNKSIHKAMELRKMFRQSRRRHKRERKQWKALRLGLGIQKGLDDVLRNKRQCKSVQISYPGMEKSITCKVIRGAEAQFNNRKGCKITPSARQLIQMHMLAIRKIMRFLPVSHIIVERVCFDFQKLENINIRAWEYSKGPLYGYKSYKEYIYELQGGKCLLCDNEIEDCHHIVQRSKGGSDNVVNIAGLCDCCHNSAAGVHKDTELQYRLLELKKGLYKKYKVGLLNSVMLVLIEEMTNFCKNNRLGFSITDGMTTYETRKTYSLGKHHYVDAYAISLSGRKVSKVIEPGYCYQMRRFKKKSNNIIHKMNDREYWFNSKLVAKNRHKREGQTFDSLEEYMAAYAKSHSEKECNRHFHQIEIKPCRRTYTFHKRGIIAKIHPGDVVKYEKRTKGNIESEIFVPNSVKISTNFVCCNNKTKSMKYCKTIEPGCIQFIK